MMGCINPGQMILVYIKKKRSHKKQAYKQYLFMASVSVLRPRSRLTFYPDCLGDGVLRGAS